MAWLTVAVWSGPAELQVLVNGLYVSDEPTTELWFRPPATSTSPFSISTAALEYRAADIEAALVQVSVRGL
jgi:hypothetical protein